MHTNIHNLDKRVLEDLYEYFTNDEVNKMVRELDREKRIEDAAIKSALEIKSHYAPRDKKPSRYSTDCIYACDAPII